MSVQAPNAEKQIWIFTQMLRIREFENRVKRSFTDHPGVIRGHTHLADGAEASIVGSLANFKAGDAALIGRDGRAHAVTEQRCRLGRCSGQSCDSPVCLRGIAGEVGPAGIQLGRRQFAGVRRPLGNARQIYAPL